MIPAETSYDVVVVGSGFAGTLLAMALHQHGRKVALIERGRHPRFAIGESSTPLANLLLEEIADEFNLPRLRTLSKYGSWQEHHSDIACGLKRGFSFYKHTPGARLRADDLSNQLLFAASPNDRISDMHWYRPDFDHFLVRQACELGLRYEDEAELTEATQCNEGVWTLRIKGRTEPITCAFVVDATGPCGWLAKHFNLPVRGLPELPAMESLYAHFSGLERLDAIDPQFTQCGLPYPVDDAALHHIIDEGWMWMLRFNNGLTSAGFILKPNVAERIRTSSPQALWDHLIGRYPTLARQFQNARAVTPLYHQQRVNFTVDQIAGPGWAMLPSAAGFIDPLLSTGFALTLLGVQRLARTLISAPPTEPERIAYQQQTQRELKATAALIGALTATMPHFDRFRDLTLLYFAAASYAETMRRLGRPGLAPGFLLCSHPGFGPEFLSICRSAIDDPKRDFSERIQRIIAPFNVAGLDRPRSHPWYPVVLDDLFASADRIGSSREELMAMLRTCGAL